MYKFEVFKRDPKMKYQFVEDIIAKMSNKPEYVGHQMVIGKDCIDALVDTSIEYMDKICGLRLNSVGRNAFVELNDLDDDMYGYIAVHRMGGYDIPGFYNKETNIITIKLGIHLDKILPVLFHELTHAYIKQKEIEIEDIYEKPTLIDFSFSGHMYKANQNEGLCELVSTFMSYYILEMNIQPSSVDEYWVGWRLCVEAFCNFADKMIKSNPNNDQENIRVSMLSVFNFIKLKKNLYKFVPMVKSDSYQKRAIRI